MRNKSTNKWLIEENSLKSQRVTLCPDIIVYPKKYFLFSLIKILYINDFFKHYFFLVFCLKSVTYYVPYSFTSDKTKKKNTFQDIIIFIQCTKKSALTSRSLITPSLGTTEL